MPAAARRLHELPPRPIVPFVGAVSGQPASPPSPALTVAMITPPSTTEASERRKPVSKKRSTRSAKWRSVTPLTKLPLVEPPDVKYARSGDVSIAYQVVGNGHVDLVFVPFLLSMIFA